MKLLPTILPISSYRGSVRACAKAYGDEHAEAIDGWLKCEIPDYAKYLRYAGRCWDIVRRWHRPLADFITACAAGAHRQVEEIVALLATEEIFHDKHCTAFGATGAATSDGQPVIAQNWDGVPRMQPWPRLLRLRTDAMPATLTYAFPGLWACAGMNEHGLSLVWTSSGCRPSVKPVAGVPTYLLVAGVLGCRDVAAALHLLERTRNAGAFNFFIADAAGEVVVVEGMPGCIRPMRCADVVSRANHYEHPQLIRRSRQRLPRATLAFNSAARGRRAADLVGRARGRIDRKAVEAMLRDQRDRPGLTICQDAVPGFDWTTIDSFYCLPAQRAFWIARGIPSRHAYVRYRV
jgi:hypothetical protein